MTKFNWASKTSILLLLGLAGFLSYQKFNQFRLQKSSEKDKQGLINQLNELNAQNTEFKNTLSYLDSNKYKEITARQQLNMQKSGEQVYNFTQTKNLNSLNQNDDNRGQSNFQKWLTYFLNEKSEN